MRRGAFLLSPGTGAGAIAPAAATAGTTTVVSGALTVNAKDFADSVTVNSGITQPTTLLGGSGALTGTPLGSTPAAKKKKKKCEQKRGNAAALAAKKRRKRK